jgi:hypothetical protein
MSFRPQWRDLLQLGACLLDCEIYLDAGAEARRSLGFAQDDRPGCSAYGIDYPKNGAYSQAGPQRPA